MFTVSINEVDYNLPEYANEVYLSQFIPFNRCYMEYCDFINKLDEIGDEEFKEIIILMATAVESYFSKTTDIDSIAGMPLGDFRNSIMTLGKAAVSRVDKSLTMVFNSLARVLGNYIPKLVDKDYRFEYKGITYVVSSIHRKDYNNSLTVSESIEVLESQRIANLLKDTKGIDNVNYSQMLTMLAVLAREEGESFPLDQTEIDEMIKERSALFQEITMDVAIDVGFFLTSFGVQ